MPLGPRNFSENIDRAYDDRGRWEDAAERGLARPFIDGMPDRYDTQLGKWFRAGRELSLGQWQKVALARSFMRKEADILVLDEPTPSMDAEAEVKGGRTRRCSTCSPASRRGSDQGRGRSRQASASRGPPQRSPRRRS